MKNALRIAMALVAGLVIGSIVNIGFIVLGGKLVSLPAGADATTTEGLKASLHLLQPKNFIFPFLAHAIGSLTGAFLASWLAPTRGMTMAFIIGGLFFVGGIISCFQIPAPKWFMVCDLGFAYFPMAFIGFKLTPK